MFNQQTLHAYIPYSSTFPLSNTFVSLMNFTMIVKKILSQNFFYLTAAYSVGPALQNYENQKKLG